MRGLLLLFENTWHLFGQEFIFKCSDWSGTARCAETNIVYTITLPQQM
jgi:hypothetical protein